MTEPSLPRRRALALVRGQGRFVALLTLSSLAAGLVEALILYIIVSSAAAMAAGSETVALTVGPLEIDDMTIRSAGAFALSLLGASLALSAASAAIVATVSTRVHNLTRKHLLAAFLGAPWSVQSQEPEGRLQEALTTHVMRTSTTIVAMGAALVAALSLVALITAAVLVQPVAAAAVVIAGGALFLILRPLRDITARVSARHLANTSAFAHDVTEIVGLAREIRVFGVSDQVEARLVSRADRAEESGLRTRFLMTFTPSMFQAAGFALVIGAVMAIGSSSAVSPSSMGTVVLLLVRSLGYGQRLSIALHQTADSEPYLARIDELEALYHSSAEPAGHLPITAVGSIELIDVSFSYRPGVPVLSGVTLSIAAGESIGIVGPSGGGKSTLVQLLLGLRRPTEGSIRVGGVDIAHLEPHSWAATVAFVPQDNRLLAGTMTENIRFFRPHLTTNEVEAAARRAFIHDDVMTLPAGYDTLIGAGHAELSGGQRQRLGLARALASRPEVLVLDEPTSALDMRSESQIQEVLRSLRGHVTLLVVAHRIPTLSHCDRIMVIEHGTMTGFGPAEELARSNAFFMEALQLSRLPA